MSSAPPTDRASGSQLIIGICVLALALASFGWWWRYHEAAAPRELWGVSHMLRIRDAKKVEVLKLAPQADMLPKPGEAIPAESFLLGSDWYVVAQSIDASQVLWITTANDARGIPKPILNRMNVFEIQPLTPAQARHIALRLYQSIRAGHDWGSRFDETPQGDVLDKLSGLVPREMRRTLMAAFGNARLASRGQLQVDDLPRSAAGKGRIGFMQ